MKFLAIAAALAAFPALAEAGAIERACIQSSRAQASFGLCGCIQRVADATLSGRDQRVAAKFFSDPHQAQVVRQSSKRSDSIFWQRYKQFGAVAESYCRG